MQIHLSDISSSEGMRITEDCRVWNGYDHLSVRKLSGTG